MTKEEWNQSIIDSLPDAFTADGINVKEWRDKKVWKYFPETYKLKDRLRCYTIVFKDGEWYASCGYTTSPIKHYYAHQTNALREHM